MASERMLPITAQQPREGDQPNPFTMKCDELMGLISPTHIVPVLDEKFDADSLFVVVKNILRRSTHIVDNLLLGQEHPENMEEKVSRVSFGPLLCTLNQLSYEMACKAPGVEIAHKTTMSILTKLSNYSWDYKAVLTLAAFALNYEDFLTFDSSHQLVESAEISKHVPAILLKYSCLQKYRKMIGELNKIINDVLDVIESILELKMLSNNDKMYEVKPWLIYWIIITIAACTTQMLCLKSDEDKTQELLPFAKKINGIRAIVSGSKMVCNLQTAEMKEERKLKELLQTPDEITKVLKALIFTKDDMQPLIDGSTNKMVSINVLKKKNVLLLITSLNISNDDISILKSIYNGILRKDGYESDTYKIVWIPIVEQWTDGLQKKFEMLRSRMPWYIVQYFSPLAGIKFIKEEWYFENEPIVVMMNPHGDVFNENAFHMIRDLGMNAFPFTSKQGRRKGGTGKDNRWIEQFSQKVNVVAEDPITKEANISIELSCLGKGRQYFWKFPKAEKKTGFDPRNQEIQQLLDSFKNESRWAVLTKQSTSVVSDQGTTILKVLEAFEEWKVNVPERGFEICFKEYHDKFHQIGPLPSTSFWNCRRVLCFGL
ncbi:protein SIEVE ELEMENT OCCLUSION B-like [Corylus avellana]|uniref:protein SIEVE ELEMENT OCCLUSION B-like n=1 Tax=Corylus avellana TaxID=13451 RepID=UPI00286B8983|nr:protein SIEVE ELEMENT OCCLUSION B-like [Corylus avellana]